MKPYYHSKNSVNKFGGVASDYSKIHNFIDSSKAHFCDARHRAILHNSFGIYLTEQVFGETITNSDGKVIPVREIAEQHVLEDLGFVPSVKDYLDGMPFYDWISKLPAEETKAVVTDKKKKPMTEKRRKEILDKIKAQGPLVSLTDEEWLIFNESDEGKAQAKKMEEVINNYKKGGLHTPDNHSSSDIVLDSAANPSARRINSNRRLD